MNTPKSTFGKEFTRRSFLRNTIAGTAAASAYALSPKSWAQVKGANETLNVGVIGFKGRGGSHISGMRALQQKEKGVRIAALCDVDKKVLDAGVQSFDKLNLGVAGYTDLRKMLENKNLDVICIATPNHWHALAAIWAIQSGKDVYVEKPVSHNVWEGRQIVNAARQHKKIVQTGTQSRSSQGIAEAAKWIQSGGLGKVKYARGLCYKPRGSIGLAQAEQPIPNDIDYDLWCGPAPLDPLRRKNLHYDWHWVWNYGNGDLGNQGIHQMDIARWILGEMELSPRVWSVGGRLGYKDDGQTPNTQIVFHDYAKAPLIFEVRGLPRAKGDKAMDNYMGGSVSVVVECEGGNLLVPNYSGAIAKDKDGKTVKEFKGVSDHFENFIDAVRSRKQTDLNADILEGHLSSALCHTGNISYQLGKQLAQGEIRDQIKADRGAAESVGRMIEHLKANEVDLDLDKLVMGPALKMNPKTEQFIGNAAADKMLTRDYRKPFVVPDLTT